ncbi:hypothetical protein C8T65DRAFT_718061 [Cerioporus squamosus]|nr:hypothetical protein C8T65DRAFT_718061 [Cerioporus squamosus]
MSGLSHDIDSGQHAPITTPRVAATSLDAIERDQELWFEDGNIVVVAQRMAFRFHRGALSRHSQVFRDMFTVPQPASAPLTESMGGCPVIHVSDTASDFKYLLRAVYDGMSLFYMGDETKEFSVLASWARMGHKYGVEHLLEGSLRQLKTVFTADFSTWESNHDESILGPEVSMRSQDAIEAANLFRLVGRTDMLVTAFYLCCHLTTKELLQGVSRVDGTPEKLEFEDVQRCLDARVQLVKYDAHVVVRFFLEQEPELSCCISSLRNPTLRDELRDAAIAFPRLLNPNPLSSGYYQRKIEGLLEEQGTFCASCAEVLGRRHAALRAKVWGDLPDIFDLKVPDWPRSYDM